MALSDLAVYSEYAYSSFSEVLRQQIDLFNSATGGAIVLQGAAHQGDFSDVAFFAKVTGGLVRRRNAYGSGALSRSPSPSGWPHACSRTTLRRPEFADSLPFLGRSASEFAGGWGGRRGGR